MAKKKNFWKKFDNFLKKNDKEVVDPLFAFLAAMGTSVNAHAFNLQSKPQNTDKSLFNVISGAKTIPQGQFRLFGESNYQVAPLVQRDSQLGEQTLVQGLLGLETSVIYGITDSLQIGLLIPGQVPFGVLGSYSQIKPSLGDILIEPKVQILNNVAIIPLYYAPTGDAQAGAGSKNGAYGMKVASEFGNIKEKGVMAVQVGAIFAPENKFNQLDQSMRYHFGVGGGLEISEGVNWLAEVYGEKTDSNFPVEALTFLELQRKDWSIRVGGGSGALNDGGSNTARAFVGFSWDLGKIASTSKKDSDPKGFYVPQVPEGTKEEIKKTPVQDPVGPTQGEKSGIQESQGPDVITPQEKETKAEEKEEIEFNLNIFDNSSTHDYLKNKDKVAVIPKGIVKQLKACYPYASEKDLVHNVDSIVGVLKDRLDCSFGYDLTKGNFQKKEVSYLVYNRNVASVDYKKKTSLEDQDIVLDAEKKLKETKGIIKKIEKRLKHAESQEFSFDKEKTSWIKNKVDKTFNTLKHAHKVLAYDLDKYQKALENEDEKSLKKQIVELRWGLRVINKRVKYIEYLDESFQASTGKTLMDEGHRLLPRTQKEIQDYSVARSIVFEFEKTGNFLNKMDSLRMTESVIKKKRKELEKEIAVVKSKVEEKNKKKQAASNEVKNLKKNKSAQDLSVKEAVRLKKVTEQELKVEQKKLKKANALKRRLEQAQNYSKKIKKRKNTIENNIDFLWDQISVIDKEVASDVKSQEINEKNRLKKVAELELKKAQEEKSLKEEKLATMNLQEKKILDQVQKEMKEESQRLELKEKALAEMEIKEAQILIDAETHLKQEQELIEKRKLEALALEKEMERKAIEAERKEKALALKVEAEQEAQEIAIKKETAIRVAKLKEIAQLKALDIKKQKEAQDLAAKKKQEVEDLKLAQVEKQKKLEKAERKKKLEQELARKEKALALEIAENENRQKELLKELEDNEKKIFAEARTHRNKEIKEQNAKKAAAIKSMNLQEQKILQEAQKEMAKKRASLEAKKALALKMEKNRVLMENKIKEQKRLEAEALAKKEVENKKLEAAKALKEKKEALAQAEVAEARILKEVQAEMEAKQEALVLKQKEEAQALKKKIEVMNLQEQKILQEAQMQMEKEKELMAQKAAEESQNSKISEVPSKAIKMGISEENENVDISESQMEKDLVDQKGSGYKGVDIKRVQAMDSEVQMLDNPEGSKVKYFKGEITELPKKGETFVSTKEVPKEKIEEEADEKTQEKPTQEIVRVEEVEKKIQAEVQKKSEKEPTQEIMSVEEVEKKIKEKAVVKTLEKTPEKPAPVEKTFEDKKKVLVEKELNLLKKEVKKVETEKALELQEIESKRVENLKEPEIVEEFKEVEIKNVEKVKAEDSKLIPIKEKGSVSITLPQPQKLSRPEPKIPAKSEKFKGLEDEDSMEYSNGPSFNSIED